MKIVKIEKFVKNSSFIPPKLQKNIRSSKKNEKTII
jgi:hypothetical protein